MDKSSSQRVRFVHILNTLLEPRNETLENARLQHAQTPSTEFNLKRSVNMSRNCQLPVNVLRRSESLQLFTAASVEPRLDIIGYISGDSGTLLVQTLLKIDENALNERAGVSAHDMEETECIECSRACCVLDAEQIEESCIEETNLRYGFCVFSL